MFKNFYLQEQTTELSQQIIFINNSKKVRKK